MGRSGVQSGNLRRLRLALCCAALILPVSLCACRQNQSLVEDDATYRVTPSRIRFDENLTYDQDLTIDDDLTLADAARITTINYTMAPEPIRLRDRKEIIKWEMTLQEVIFHALSNSKVIRQGGGQFLSPNNGLLRSPESVPTVYDQAIQSTGVLFGQRGEQVESLRTKALAGDFDGHQTAWHRFRLDPFGQPIVASGIPAQGRIEAGVQL